MIIWHNLRGFGTEAIPTNTHAHISTLFGKVYSPFGDKLFCASLLSKLLVQRDRKSQNSWKSKQPENTLPRIQHKHITSRKPKIAKQRKWAHKIYRVHSMWPISNTEREASLCVQDQSNLRNEANSHWPSLPSGTDP